MSRLAFLGRCGCILLALAGLRANSVHPLMTRKREHSALSLKHLVSSQSAL